MKERPRLPKISKAWPAGFIDAGNLAIEDGAFHFQMVGNPGGELGKASEGIPVPGNQPLKYVTYLSDSTNIPPRIKVIILNKLIQRFTSQA